MRASRSRSCACRVVRGPRMAGRMTCLEHLTIRELLVASGSHRSRSGRFWGWQVCSSATTGPRTITTSLSKTARLRPTRRGPGPRWRGGGGRFHELVAGLVEDPAEVVVATETDRGLFVGSLVAAGYTVLAVNPLSVPRYRERHSTSGAKSDPGDARVLAELARTDHHNHRRIAGDSDLVNSIKVLTRAHQGLIWTRQRQLNQLRSTLRDSSNEFGGLRCKSSTSPRVTWSQKSRRRCEFREGNTVATGPETEWKSSVDGSLDLDREVSSFFVVCATF